MEVVPKKFKYKQKKDNRGSTIEHDYTLVCVGGMGVAWLEKGRTDAKNCVQCIWLG